MWSSRFERHMDARHGAFTLGWSWGAFFLGPIWYLRWGMWDLALVYSGMVLIFSSQFDWLAIPASFVVLALVFRFDAFRHEAARLERVVDGELGDLMHPNVTVAELRMAHARGWLSDAELDRLLAVFDERESKRSKFVLRSDAYERALSKTKEIRLRDAYRARFGLRDDEVAEAPEESAVVLEAAAGEGRDSD